MFFFIFVCLIINQTFSVEVGPMGTNPMVYTDFLSFMGTRGYIKAADAGTSPFQGVPLDANFVKTGIPTE